MEYYPNTGSKDMIPLQLKDMKFCRVIKGTKEAWEDNWPDIHYTYEEINKYFPQENYGVLTGLNNLGVLDDDTGDEKLLLNLYDKNFSSTFRVRGHYYIFLDGWDGKKIKFYHPTRLFLNKKGKLTNEIGEFQGKGQMVVGAGSLHPSGELYEVKQDLPIIRIQYEDFKKVFNEFIKNTQVREIKIDLIKFEGEDISHIPITNIFPGGLVKCPSCGCSTGTNFKVYPESNSYFCFHAWTGGGIWEAIAVSEGIKDCPEIGKGCLTKSEASQVIQIARNKYGLKSPEFKPLFEPQGWALSIKISRMAERKGLLNCPKCSNPFQFKDSHGLFYCKTCKQGGSIKKFVKLYIKS